MKNFRNIIKKLRVNDGSINLIDWQELSVVSVPRIDRNIVKMDDSGKIDWVIGGMEALCKWNSEVEMFVDIKRYQNEIWATSFGGFSFFLRESDGVVFEVKFVK